MNVYLFRLKLYYTLLNGRSNTHLQSYTCQKSTSCCAKYNYKSLLVFGNIIFYEFHSSCIYPSVELLLHFVVLLDVAQSTSFMLRFHTVIGLL